MGNAGLAIGNVVADSIVEENCLLGDVADLAAEGSQADIAQVMSIDLDAACGNVKEAGDQVNQRRLAGAAGTYQRDYFAPRDHQVDVLQHLPFAFFIAVVEADILDPDFFAEFFEGACAWPSPAPRPGYP